MIVVTEVWVYPSPEPPNKGLVKGLIPRERHLCAITSNFSSSQKIHAVSSLRFEKDDEKDLLAGGYDREKGIAFR